LPAVEWKDFSDSQNKLVKSVLEITALDTVNTNSLLWIYSFALGPPLRIVLFFSGTLK
jgi:hypothetical protein